MDNKRLSVAAAGGVGSAIAALLITHESGGKLHLTAYKDPVGIWTICDGITKLQRDGIRRPVKEGDKATKKECDNWRGYEIAAAMAVVDACTPNQPDHIRVAMGDFVYNVGGSKYCSSTIAVKLNSGDIQGACDGLMAWVKGRIGGKLVPLNGLVKRRADDRRWCMEGTE